jgi:hypothetical protein
LLTERKVAAIGQGLIGSRDPGVKEELADIFVTRPCSFLQQLLYWAAGADINPFGLR